MNDSKDSQNTCSSVLRAIGSGRGRGGPGLGTLLTVLFIGLKLTDHIAWSWWWVLSPIWIKFLLILPFILMIIIARKRTGWKPTGET